ncbi:MAG: copper chaperone [Bacillus sp. (in: firmicutes)]|nr:copper chaperone [Bacillus sp. (in: firmicutes)]
MNKVKFQLEPLSCPSCIKKIEGTLKKMIGVDEANVLFNSSKVKVTFDSTQINPEDLQRTIEKLGYEVLSMQRVVH